MEIIKTQDGQTLTVTVKGCLDTTTSPDLQVSLEGALVGVTSLLFDFTDLEYVSSAGFRVLLMANKKMMASGGTLTIRNVQPAVREVFEMTGFADIFNIL